MDFIEVSKRVKALPPYLFLEIDRAKRKAKSKGADIIDFGIGDPDQPTPGFVKKAFNQALKDHSTHQYPLDAGRPELRKALAAWCKKRFGVTLDPDREILPLIGSKEGLAHLPLAFVNPGDRVLIPDPGYPAYRSGVGFAGGKSVSYPLHESRGYLPDWTAIRKNGLKDVRMMYLNYPSNPTSAVATLRAFNEGVLFAKKHKIILCHDNAYSEIYYDRKRPLSFLEAKGAKDVGIEFHSFSKTFNMTGWRLGFACGNAKLIQGLARVKSNIDSGVFSAIQLAGVEALKQADVFTKKMNRMYKKRRDLLVSGLKSLGWDVKPPEATFYLWCRIPQGAGSSMEFTKFLLEKAGIVATPGVGFGKNGEGYIRFTLTVPETRIRQALQRLKKVL